MFHSVSNISQHLLTLSTYSLNMFQMWISLNQCNLTETKPYTYKAIQSLAADTLLRELRDVILLRSWKVHENSMNRWANHSAEACFNKVRNGPMLETLVTLTCGCSFQLVKSQDPTSQNNCVRVHDFQVLAHLQYINAVEQRICSKSPLLAASKVVEQLTGIEL